MIALTITVVAAVSAVGGTWQIVTVDSTGDVGGRASLALDAFGNPRISYYDATNAAIKYASRDGAVWQMQNVDSAGKFGSCTSLALDALGNPRVSYFDQNYALKYAAWNGSTWQTQMLDNTWNIILGLYTSLALDGSGNPRISYYANGTMGYPNSGDDLKYAAWNGSGWQIQTVDSTGIVGWHPSLALDSADNPRISYHDATNGDLKYAAWNGSGWQVQVVDGVAAVAPPVGAISSLALDSAGYPHISYSGEGDGSLKYAVWNGSTWQLETVDTAAFLTSLVFTSLALDSSGNPRITYCSNTGLKYAAWDGQAWQIEFVDSNPGLAWTSLALDTSSNPHISYYDHTNGDLKYAELVPEPSSFILFGVGAIAIFAYFLRKARRL